MRARSRSATSQRLRDDQDRSTAVSYECSSDLFLSALLEAIESTEDPDPHADDNEHDDSSDDVGVTILRDIQDRLVEKHLHNGTLRERPFRPTGTTTSSPLQEGAAGAQPRRVQRGGGRRRRHRPKHANNEDNRAAANRERTILSFVREE